MKGQNHILYLILLGFLLSCQSDPEKKFEEDDTFPVVKKIEEYKATIILPTLETNLSTEVNGVYAASLLMVWDELKKTLAEPITEIIGTELADFDQSTSHVGVLSSDEYSSTAEIDSFGIRVRAYFKKSLPFVIPFEKEDNPLIFKNQPVEAFGFWGSNRAAAIVYYKNDNDFALRLKPEDPEHEILLFTTSFSDRLILAKEVEKLQKLEKDFKNAWNENNNWKYYLNDNDRAIIPIVEFNIASNFTEMEGSFVCTENRKLNLEEIYQRTAFILNEKGAELESEAVMYATEEMEEELPKPKKLIFDKPFLIMLKRKDSQFPYFALFVSNSELLLRK